MADLFAITDRQLARDKASKQVLLLAISFLLAIAWMVWLFLARVALYATTAQARVQVAHGVYSVQAPVSGRVLRSYLEQGRKVEKGNLLVELAALPQTLRIQAVEMQRATLDVQLRNLQAQLAAQRQARAAERAADRFAIEQARASIAEAQDAAGLAQGELTKELALYRAGIASQEAFLRSQSDLKTKQIELQSARSSLDRTKREQLMNEGERQADIEALEGDVGRIKGEVAASGNTMLQIQNELGLHQIRASGQGRLDEVLNLKPGSYVREGDRLAVIVPKGRLQVVAYFQPSAAIGRIKRGETGRLRLQGFPWSRGAPVEAVVTSVGSEPVENGGVRVQLNPWQPPMQLQDGMTGTLEVQVGRITPAAYLLRRAGAYLGKPASSEVASR